MHKKILLLIFCLSSLMAPINPTLAEYNEVEPQTISSRQLYAEIGLQNIVNFDAFDRAVAGYYSVKIGRKDVMTLIDFSKPSTQERLFVLDMQNKRLLFSTVVSHGKNSGDNYATSFSNKIGSLQSSLGFFVTENTYQGKHGYSLILNGLEKGINDRAKERAIVIHSAAYANPSVIKTGGRLGRSFGCPALPENISKNIINTIKDGTLLFIYADDKNYIAQSTIIPSHFNITDAIASLN